MTPNQAPAADEPQTIMAIFTERGRAESAVSGLRQRGIPEDRISLLVRHDDITVTPEEAVAIDREAESAGTAVALGGTVGGLAGLLGGLAMFSIPGIGPFLGVGVLATTIGGAALGSAAGERAAHFGRLGLSAERSSRYGSALETGEVVIAVDAQTSAEVMASREVLALQQAAEIDVLPRQRGA